MKRFKREKGITLIALIITIIVMLILVGVTVTVAIQGDLFNIASDASAKTTLQADKETLQASVVAAYNVDKELVEKDKLESNLSSNWTVTGEGPYTCTSPNGNGFTVDKKGNISQLTNKVQKGIKIGDNWQSIGLTNLPQEEPTEFTDRIEIFIENEETKELWIVIYDYEKYESNMSTLDLGYEDMKNDNIEFGVLTYFWVDYTYDNDMIYKKNEWVRTRNGDQSEVKNRITGVVKGIAVNGVLDSNTEETTTTGCSIKNMISYSSESEDVEVPIEFVNWFNL